MAAKTKKISTLIESQLPGFITDQYGNFSKFVEKYYEQLEVRGQPLDIINNITKYRDINFYDSSIFIESTKLNGNLTDSATTITVEDATSFPEENGYIKINNEICFYKERTNTQFLEVSRGVSGTTTLGDLYSKSEFVTTQAESHIDETVVTNISNLFLYAFVRNFEQEYLDSFPEKYLKQQIDKRTLIKNISDFYRAKGTDRSIKFLFDTIISKDPIKEDVSVYNPKDFTYKASVSDWASDYSIKVVVVSGNPDNLVGSVIQQEEFARATVDKIKQIDNITYELVLDPSTIVGDFKIASRTKLVNPVLATILPGDRIDVSSTLTFPDIGTIRIGSTILTYTEKTVNQFIISSTSQINLNYPAETNVYDSSLIRSGDVELVPFGLIYNITTKNPKPYSSVGDFLQITNNSIPSDPVISDPNGIRWFLNNTLEKAESVHPNVNSKINKFVSDVSAIFEDEQYYYIASSSYPGDEDLLTSTFDGDLTDQQLLKIIRKHPITNTEIYPTTNSDIGVLVDGSPIFGYKDTDVVYFGQIESFEVSNRGSNYVAAPYVLINEEPNKARCFLQGDRVSSIELLDDKRYSGNPLVRITSGEGAVLSPVVTEGKITSLTIKDPGKYYSSPPNIIIIDRLGKGKFAEYQAVLNSNGEIAQLITVNPGRLYTRGFIDVIVEPVGVGAEAKALVKKWTKNRYKKLEGNLDTNNGYSFNNGYGVVSNPRVLRKRLSDNITSGYQETNTIVHSPILGYAYDGNPIYGPYGFSNPLDKNSSIVRLNTGYILRSNREDGPSINAYALGSFIEDYEFVPTINTEKTRLDQNNGRFCVTPDYPNGVYAYFLTIDSSNIPQFPYFLGENFYSIPVESNYNGTLSQKDIPSNCRRIGALDTNGVGTTATVDSISKGNISSVSVINSPENFKVNSQVVLDESDAEGSGGSLFVSSITGKQVNSIESTQTPALKINTVTSSYYFAGDVITQVDSTGDTVFAGTVIGDVINDNIVVLRDLEGSFDNTKTINGETEVIRVIVDKQSSFTKGATLSLTDGLTNVDSIIATGQVLEGTSRQNSVIIKVISGEFIVDDNYFLKSSNLSDTSKAEILNITSISSDVEIFEYNDSIAIVETDENHELSIGDKVTIDLVPNEISTETTYYVRKKLYQKVKLQPITHKSKLIDSGIGSIDLLNTGNYYQSGTYEDVELIFIDQSLARPGIGSPGDLGNAKVTISIYDPFGLGFGPIGEIEFTSKGSGYRKGDILTVNDIPFSSQSDTQTLFLVVDHVGFARTNAIMYLSNVNNLSIGDYVKIDSEIVKVGSVNQDEKSITVFRAQKGTKASNHYDGAEVSIEQGFYNFDSDYRPLGDNPSSPYFSSFDVSTNELIVSFDYSITNPTKIQNSSVFFDQSQPQKLIKVRSAFDVVPNLEFSKGNQNNFISNPVIEIQKYYSYKFDTSHPSMVDTYLDFSSSINYNIFSEEKFVSSVSPGINGSYVSVKFGFGPKIEGIDQVRQEVNFQNYYYFIKASSGVDTTGSYLKIIDDPLSGTKEVDYITDTKFVYLLDKKPQYDGSGEITYTTTSEFAVGKISSIGIKNSGSDYSKVPLIEGCYVANRASVVPTIDTVNGSIVNLTVESGGGNYVNPKVFIKSTNGSGAAFDVFTINGEIDYIIVTNPGKNYDFDAEIEIIESDIDAYLESSNIGLPKNIKLFTNGNSFHNDKTLLPQYTSHITLLLKDFEDYTFAVGELIYQDSTNSVGKISDWRQGSNILKLTNVIGKFDIGEIRNDSGSKTVNVISNLTTEFDLDIRSYSDNLGNYKTERGLLDSPSQRITDSYFYQDYSYVIRSKTSINDWRDLVKETTHPAGFKLFGEMVIDSKSKIPGLESEKVVRSVVSTIEIPPVNVVSYNTLRRDTINIVIARDLKPTPGRGAIVIDQFDFTETRAYEVELLQEFTGDFDPDTGQKIGDTQFTLIDKKSGLPLVTKGDEHLFITIDGVLQEPGVSFTTNSSTIVFSEAPFGVRIVEGQEVSPQRFFGKYIEFKDNNYNNRYFRKIKDVSDQFDNEKTEFNLYWSDGSIVKSERFENFVVVIDGVLQRYKDNSETQFTNSYYIKRSEEPLVTDKIVFTEPPKFIESPYEEAQVKEFENRSRCSIHGVGNYDRLTIPRASFGSGPHLMVDEVSGFGIIEVSNPQYALVFLDGVLQENRSYTIVGNSITFSEALKTYEDESGIEIYQKVDILVFYGRDKDKTLTAHNFERFGFTNQVTILINGTDISSQIEVDPSVYTFAHQGDNYIGQVLAFTKKDNNNIELIVENRDNLNYNDSLPLEFYSTVGNVNTVLTGDYTVTSIYTTDSDGVRILERKATTPWLYRTELNESAWQTRNKLRASILAGDKIKIDGESEYRIVKEVPSKAYLKDYRAGSPSGDYHFGKILTSAYSGEQEGYGLTVQAVVENGSIIELEWNYRDWSDYINGGSKPKTYAKGYYTEPFLFFVPKTNSGGGARARVIINPENGYVLDVVLIDGGSEYEEAPDVFVGRSYDIIKERKIQQERTFILPFNLDNITPKNIFAITEIVAEGETVSATAIFSVFQAELEAIFTSETVVIIDKQISVGEFLSKSTEIYSYITYDFNPIYVGIDEDDVSFTVTRFVESANTAGQIELKVFEETTNIVELSISNKLIPVFLGTTSDLGAFLAAPMSLTDTVVYASGTTLFPDSGKLLIGKELVYYSSKDDVNTRFLNAQRGYLGSTVATHNAGDYFRLIPDMVSVISMPITITAISQISASSVQEISQRYLRIIEPKTVGELLIPEYKGIKIEHTINIKKQSDVKSVSKEILLTGPGLESDDLSVRLTDNKFTELFLALETFKSQLSTTNKLNVTSKVQEVVKIIDLNPISTSITDNVVQEAILLIESIAPGDLNFGQSVTDIKFFIEQLNLVRMSLPNEDFGAEVLKTIQFTLDNVKFDILKEIIVTLPPQEAYGGFISAATTSQVNVILETNRDKLLEVINSIQYLNIGPESNTVSRLVTNTLQKLIELDINIKKEILVTGPQLEFEESVKLVDILTRITSIVDQQETILSATNKIADGRYIDITNTVRKIIPLSLSVTRKITEWITPDRKERFAGILNAISDQKITQIIETLDSILQSITELSVGPDGVQSIEIEKEQSLGAVDSIETDVILLDFIELRDNTLLSLNDPDEVSQRSGTVYILNEGSVRKFDYLSYPNAAVERDLRYSSINVGFNLRTIENNAFIDTGVFDVDGNIGSITGQIQYYTSVTPTLTIEDFTRRALSKYTIGGETVKFGIPTITEFGALLDGDITSSSSTINIKYSLPLVDLTAENNPIKNFPDSGKLLIGNEVVSYTGKTFTSFTGVIRGIDGTTAQSHLDDDYLRTTR